MSNVIKASLYRQLDEFKEIKISKRIPVQPRKEPQREHEESEKDAIMNQAKADASEIMAQAHQDAQSLLEQTREQCEKLKQEAEQEIAEKWKAFEQEKERLAQEARERGQKEGFEQGREEGRRESLREYQDLIEKSAYILESAQREKEKIISEAEPFLIELSTQIAQKIIAEELSLNPDKMTEMVAEALARVRVIGTITLSVDPEYHAFVMQNRERLLRVIDGQSELMIIPDHQLKGGGCVIQTPMGSLDARIDTQLEEVKKALLEVARGSEKHESDTGEQVPEGLTQDRSLSI
ncbi:MAG: flagellar assembly protein FliH [Bacillaceae bacterium]|nr:flagellar assembly protein FliH [Bacillaceae bacterium]